MAHECNTLSKWLQPAEAIINLQSLYGDICEYNRKEFDKVS